MTSARVLCLVILAYVAASAFAQCSGSDNTLPIYATAPTFVKQVKNGKLFTLPSADPPIKILHLWGTPYEQGVATGQLIGDDIKEQLSQALAYIDQMVAKFLDMLPDWLAKLIADEGVVAALDLTYELTKSYTPQHFYDEMKGICDASGADYWTMVRLNMFPELIQAECSMYGAWGSALANVSGANLVQLRALDWNMHGPFQKFPLITVYHPNDPNSFDFANVGFAGLVGSLAGFSSSPVAVSEKVWYAYNGTKPRNGYPWHFLLRDILEFDADVSSAANRIINAQRTCSIWLGVGDGHENQFRVFQYSHDYVNILDDINMPSWDGHPRIPHVVYVDKHVQPSHNPCFAAMLQKYYGNLSAETSLRRITPQTQSGDTMTVVYDFGKMEMYVAFASPVGPQGQEPVPAYNRSFGKLNMKTAFQIAPPNTN